MFNLIKKDKDKEKDARKEKKKKKEKKERMSAAELKSLEEMSVRRGLFHRAAKKDVKSKLEISSPRPAHTDQVDLGVWPTSTRDDAKVEVISRDERRSSVRERAAKLARQSSQVGQMMKRLSFSQKNKDESPLGASTSPPGELHNKHSPASLESNLQQPPARFGDGMSSVRIPQLVDRTFPADLRSPPVEPPSPPEMRELEVRRRDTGDFGFSLRRSSTLDRRAPEGSTCRHMVHFAEPGAGVRDVTLGLVPGDRLVEINGVNVEKRNRDEIVEMIRQSGEAVWLKVQPIPELKELSRCWLRSLAGLGREAREARTEEQIAVEQTWHIKGQVWLVHREGFSLATLEGREGDGKVKIRLEHNGTELVVDEDDVEKANPPSVCHVQDAASLHYLNESSVVQVVCRRSAAGLLHTYAGPHMLLLSRTCTPALYSEKIMLMFKGCRRDNVAPHVYSMAQAAYRSLLTTRHDQALVLLGRSGAGKSLTAQHLLHYLSTVAGSSGKAFYVEKWQAVQTVLEAFGNSATCNNNNSTRFTLITSLHFDQSGQVASSSVQTLLLEKTRVTRQPDGESTFHVFYYLLAGADDSLRNELHLNHFAESNAFGIVPHSKSEDKQRSSQQFMKLQAAMKLLGVCAEEQKALWLILGAIYHLGAAGATTGGRLQFVHHEWAQKAAYLLGCSLEDLASHTFKQQHKSATHRAKSTWLNLDTQNSTEANGSSLKALECLEVLAWGLYSEVFSLLISLVNRSLKSSQSCVCSLLIVDSPGLQNPQRAATFQELCHNYTQERLNTLFYERSVTNELERYREENIELALEDIESGVSPSIAVVDQLSRQSQVRTLPPPHTQPRGLIWLMEEEALQPNGSEEALLEQLFSNYTPAQEQDRGPVVLLRGEQPLRFLLGHSHGTHWVEYDAHDWLLHARHTGRIAAALLHNSQKKSLSSLFVGRAGGTDRLEGGSQLRKSYHTSVARVKKSLCIHVKLTVDALIDTLRKSRLHFLHCLIPRACVGGSPMEAGPMELDPALLRAQIRGFRLLDALRVYRHGYPDHLVFSEFRRRFEVLVTQLSKKRGRSSIVTDEQRAAQELLEVLELEKSSYHMGLSKVFFRAGALARLEEQRDEQIGRNMVLLQAECRGHLSRVAFRRRKVQDLAIRCIQKNIQKNRGVKDWPWWKLLTAVRPLIQVQLTEEQIRGKDEEIRQLKGKLDKLEKERTELRLNNDRLDSRITELSTELAEERSAAESASQMLEVELSERLRQEKELQELQNQQEAGQKQMEAMQMEVMEARLLQVSEVNVEMDAEENGTSGGEWRLRYERLMREADFKRKKLQQELDDKLEDEQQSRRQLERKLTDLQADHEESQHAVQQLKKKSHRQAAELQDIRLHMETQQRRNHELEKKQRKFDLEQAQVQDELQREKNMKEKACREKELLSSEMLSLRQQLQERQGEASSARLRVEQLEVELQDLSSQETRDEVSLARLRKHLRELENKAKEQEEELDEQAGAIQMLEQAKLRLEMEMERLRQSHTKELEGHEEEVEQIRQSCSKKLKQIEIQLEEEHHEKQKVLRERKELETRLRSVQEQVSQCDVDGERRLKKDLKRTKVLLADAQIMLEHLKTNTSSKREISQIKSQLEESESSYAAALKSRKAMELELEELHAQMDDVSKTKAALEEQLSRLQREKNDLQLRVEEDQEDMNDLMKKHKVVITQSAWNLAQISDLQVQLDEAIKEKQEVQDKFQALQSQLEFVEQSTVEKCVVSRQETKICELETKLEYERSQTRRLESAAARLKENMEKLVEERDQHVAGEIREREQTKRLQRQIRELKEEIGEHVKREAEATQRKHQLELDMEGLEASNHSLQADLKLAFKRIGDLQSALEDDVESDDKDDLLHSADSDTDTQVDSMKSWLSQNKISSIHL